MIMWQDTEQVQLLLCKKTDEHLLKEGNLLSRSLTTLLSWHSCLSSNCRKQISQDNGFNYSIWPSEPVREGYCEDRKNQNKYQKRTILRESSERGFTQAADQRMRRAKESNAKFYIMLVIVRLLR